MLKATDHATGRESGESAIMLWWQSLGSTATAIATMEPFFSILYRVFVLSLSTQPLCTAANLAGLARNTNLEYELYALMD